MTKIPNTQRSASIETQEQNGSPSPWGEGKGTAKFHQRPQNGQAPKRVTHFSSFFGSFFIGHFGV
jgi:hypothetical protein